METQNYVCRLIDYDADKSQHLVVEMLTDNGQLLGVARHRCGKLEEAQEMQDRLLEQGLGWWPGLADKRTGRVKS